MGMQHYWILRDDPAACRTKAAGSLNCTRTAVAQVLGELATRHRHVQCVECSTTAARLWRGGSPAHECTTPTES